MTDLLYTFELPNWSPLERAVKLAGLPPEACSAYMWMAGDGKIQAYKHRDTRCYVRLSGAEPLPVCLAALATASRRLEVV